METEKIEQLSACWSEISDEVMRLEEVDFLRLQTLFSETFDVIEKFSKEELVPKQMSELLLEMFDFELLVVELEESPLSKFYQGILDLVWALRRYFLYRNYDAEVIRKAIEKISEGSFSSDLS